MKLVTLNLQGYFDWQERHQNIVDYLQIEKPDVILFQEVVFLPSISYQSQAQVINQSIRYHHEHIAIPRLQDSPYFPEYREGLATLSTLPVVKSEVITLKKQPEDEHQRIVQLIDIQYGENIIKLANVHFSIPEEFSKLHLEELFEILYSRNERRIIGGDFNTTKLDTYSHLWEKGYTATATEKYISFPSENKQIDYFLVPKEYTINKIEISPDGLSDHLAIAIEIS